MDKQRIVCIGGGTGTFVVLRGLKNFPIQLSAIVAMSDSGGSNKRIRDEFGLLPTSDIRQCLVALSEENGGVGILRKLFMYRFEKGEGISGMTFGNLFMAALSDILGSQKEAIAQTHKILRIKGTIIPVSFTDTNLFATYEDGSTLTEEHLIDEPHHDGRLKITDISLRPEAAANPEAIRAIVDADLIVLGPGDLYTSLLPNFLVNGIPQALAKTRAKSVYIINLMTKYGQTYGFTAMDHVRKVEQYVGRVDTVIINTSPFPANALILYAKYHEQPVIDDIPSGVHTAIRGDFINSEMIKKSKSDTLVRSLIRHDSRKLAAAIVRLLRTV